MTRGPYMNICVVLPCMCMLCMLYVYVDPCILMYTHLLLETCVIPLLWLKNEVIMLLLLLLY
jgi:hypothetical protein